MNTTLLTVIIIIVGLLLVWIARGWYMGRVESTDMQVLWEQGDIQIRRTSPTIRATVTVSGPAHTAANRAFRILAGYIFGANTSQDSIAMTAPVITTPVSEKIAMTAPVISSPMQDGSSDVSFVMPAQYTMNTLPVPNDDRIRIAPVLPATIAVITFDGYVSSTSRVQKYYDKLLTTLQENNISVIGEMSIAQYNDPYTPWFMRTNEIRVEVDYSGQ